MRGVGRVRTRGALLGLGLALSLAAPAGAISQLYALNPGSQFTPAGGEAEALSGTFDLFFLFGFCDVELPTACNRRFRFTALDLASDGLDLTLTPLVAIPGLFEFFPGDLQIGYSDIPMISGLVVDRTTLPPLFQGEQRFRDLVLRTSEAGWPGNRAAFDRPAWDEFPTSIGFDLELVDVRRLVIFGPIEDSVSTLSSTTLGTLSLTASPVPEPHAALLLGGGLALLAAMRRRM